MNLWFINFIIKNKFIFCLSLIAQSLHSFCYRSLPKFIECIDLHHYDHLISNVYFIRAIQTLRQCSLFEAILLLLYQMVYNVLKLKKNKNFFFRIKQCIGLGNLLKIKLTFFDIYFNQEVSLVWFFLNRKWIKTIKII